MKEIWKPVIGYEPYYEVSNMGKIKSIRSNKILKTDKYYTNGYIMVSLSVNGARMVTTLHSLVAKAFVSNPNNKPQVNHKDGNKRNNKASNFEWVTNKENQLHCIKLGLKTPAKGEKAGLSKLKEADIHKIRYLRSKGLTALDIASYFDIELCDQTIFDIINGKTWKHIPHLPDAGEQLNIGL